MPLAYYWPFLFIIIPIIIIVPIGLYLQGNIKKNQDKTIERMKLKLKRCSVCGHNEFEFGKPSTTSMVVVFNKKRHFRIAVKCKKCGHVMEFVEP